MGVRYLYQPSELEGGRHRAIDYMWSLRLYRLGRSVTKPEEPVLYYLLDRPARGFVREVQRAVPPDTYVLPPMVFSNVENRIPSVYFAFKVGQPYIVTSVAHGVV